MVDEPQTPALTMDDVMKALENPESAGAVMERALAEDGVKASSENSNEPATQETQAPSQASEEEAPASATTPPAPASLTESQLKQALAQALAEERARWVQEQQQQQQTTQGRRPQTPEEFESVMIQLGLNPADPVHRLTCQQGIELAEARLAAERMQNEFGQWRSMLEQQAQHIMAQETVAKSVNATLNSYGQQVPAAVKSEIVARATAAVARGADPAAAIDAEMRLIRPFLQKAAPSARTQPNEAAQRQIRAIATNGRTTGQASTQNQQNGPSMDQIMKAMFS